MSKLFVIIFISAILSIFSQTTIILPSQSTIPNIGNKTEIETQFKKSSSGGLSTGAICAIAIPCVALLLGVGLAAALLKGAAAAPVMATAPTVSLPPPNYVDISQTHLNVPQPVQVQTVPQIVEPPPPQFEPQPIQQVFRPNYPVRQLEPPAVNKAFQPMIQGPQVQMVPVQQVEMVPVERVEMVPVQEVVPVQQVLPGQNIATVNNIVNVPLQQVQQVQHIVQAGPQVGQIGEIPSSTGFVFGNP